MKIERFSGNLRMAVGGAIPLLVEKFKYLENLLSANGYSEKNNCDG